MTITKADWDKLVTPTTSDSEKIQTALNWWHNLPVQNLIEPEESWASYLMKHFPSKSHPYHLTSEEVLHIFEKEQP